MRANEAQLISAPAIGLWGELGYWPRIMADYARFVADGLPNEELDLRELAGAYEAGLRDLVQLTEQVSPRAASRWGAAMGAYLTGRLVALVTEVTGLIQYIVTGQWEGRLRTTWATPFYAGMLVAARLCLENLERVAAGAPVPLALDLLHLHTLGLAAGGRGAAELGTRVDVAAGEQSPWFRQAARFDGLRHEVDAWYEVLALGPHLTPALLTFSRAVEQELAEWHGQLATLLQSEAAAGTEPLQPLLVDHMAREARYFLHRTHQLLVAAEEAARADATPDILTPGGMPE